MGMMGGGGDSAFTYKALIFVMVTMIMLPMMIGIFCPANLGNVDQDEVLDGYEKMTGRTADTKVSVWVLTGIYEPYDGSTTGGYTEDGWLYGSEVRSYTPSQYDSSTPQYLTVYKDDNGVFRYWTDTKDYNKDLGLGHQGKYRYATQEDVDAGDAPSVGTLIPNNVPGELYTSVNFDVSQKSSIFFTESGRVETEDGHFFFNYDGYRMAFQPISNYTTLNADGIRVPVIATTTSLSMVWYQFYNQSGLTGQLILSGSSGGIAYLNSAQILSAFNSSTSTASFDLVFNGITMTVIIKLDSYYLMNGWTVQQCYDQGYWSIMVTSLSADSSAYTGTDFSLNPMNLIGTTIDLFTFNFDHYNMSPEMGAIASILYVAPLYAFLISLCLTYTELWILVGILGAIQSIAAVFNIFGG